MNNSMMRSITIEDVKDLLQADPLREGELDQYLLPQIIIKEGSMILSSNLKKRYAINIDDSIYFFDKNVPSNFIKYTGPINQELWPCGMGKLNFNNTELSGFFYQGFINDSEVHVKKDDKDYYYSFMFNNIII